MGEIIDFFIHLNWTGLVIPLVIDIGIIVYFVKGYNQGKGDGLIMSSIDLLSFLLVIIMAVLFAEPAVIKIRSMAGRNELIRKHVVSWITPFRMFIILLIALAILFYFINKLVKGPLKGTITKVKIISKVNDFLGGLFGLLKRFFIVYIIVSLLMLQNFMPFVKQEIKQTGVACNIIRIIPQAESAINDYNKKLGLFSKDEIKHVNRETLEDLIVFFVRLHRLGLMTDKMAVRIVEDVLANRIIDLSPRVTAETKRQFMAIVKKTDMSKTKKARVKASLVV